MIPFFFAAGLDQTTDKPLRRSTDQFSKHDGRHTVGHNLENASTKHLIVEVTTDFFFTCRGKKNPKATDFFRSINLTLFFF